MLASPLAPYAAPSLFPSPAASTSSLCALTATTTQEPDLMCLHQALMATGLFGASCAGVGRGRRKRVLHVECGDGRLAGLVGKAEGVEEMLGVDSCPKTIARLAASVSPSPASASAHARRRSPSPSPFARAQQSPHATKLSFHHLDFLSTPLPPTLACDCVIYRPRTPNPLSFLPRLLPSLRERRGSLILLSPPPALLSHPLLAAHAVPLASGLIAVLQYRDDLLSLAGDGEEEGGTHERRRSCESSGSAKSVRFEEEVEVIGVGGLEAVAE